MEIVSEIKRGGDARRGWRTYKKKKKRGLVQGVKSLLNALAAREKTGGMLEKERGGGEKLGESGMECSKREKHTRKVASADR